MQERLAERKATFKSFQRAYVEREKALDYSKRLEKAWKHADALAARAEDECAPGTSQLTDPPYHPFLRPILHAFVPFGAGTRSTS